MVEEESWGSAVRHSPLWCEHFAKTQGAWRTRVKASESLQSARKPGSGSSVWNCDAAERDSSSDSLAPRSAGLVLGWSPFHPPDTLREDFCQHERGQERHLSLVEAPLEAPSGTSLSSPAPGWDLHQTCFFLPCYLSSCCMVGSLQLVARLFH